MQIEMQEAKQLDCRKALERLVAREPSAGNDLLVAPLLREDNPKDADILAAVQMMLLRPTLTVAVVGCFRPVLLRLVHGLLQSLRHLWLQGTPDLSSRENEVMSNLASPEHSKSWGLGIHEHAVMALSRLLELAPYTLEIVLQYFAFAPAPFERLLHPGILPKDAPPMLDVVRACYRYLQLEPKSFRDLWDWSPFLDLLQWTETNKLVGTEPQVELDVRWCAVQVLSIVLRMSDATTRALSSTVSHLTEEDCFACLMRWEAFSHEISVEKAGMYLDCNLVDEDEAMEEVDEIDSPKTNILPSLEGFQSVVRWRSEEGSSFVEVCGVQLHVRQDVKRTSSSTMSLVLTPTVKRNLEAVVLALGQRQPILLEGPLGAGKSVLIHELANITGNSDVVFIHLDDQMDSKTLLGNYVCTEIPGEFKWQPGALTQAVVQGMWVVFEDIDRAPFEILSALVPLLEDRKLYIAGRGELIHAAENFYLFSTVTRTKFGSANRASGGKDMLNNLWRKVVIDAPSDEELAVIIEARFPMLSILISRLIGTLNIVREIASQSTFLADGLGTVSVNIGRQFSTRDLIKWCQRLAVLGSQHFEGRYLSSYVRERIYVEAVDCFAGSISSIADRHLVMRAVAQQWEIPLERVDYFTRMNKPSLQVSRSSVQVGRATLLISSYQDKNQARVFAQTGHAMRILESIALCVQQKEPVLLVGETGTGKTTLVQYLARQMSMPLVVLNLSQQSDSVDLLGGYKPMEAQSVCIPLFEVFSGLFRQTFPVKKNAGLLEKVGQLAGKKKWDRLLKAFRSTVGTVAKLAGSSFSLREPVSTSSESLTQDAPDMGAEEHISKRKRQFSDKLLDKWRRFSFDLHKAERQVESARTAFAFSFVEGALVKALKEGHWILLDEVNLAPTETLERLTGVLEGEKGSLCLTERGDVESIKWHSDFRIFACMNPATDVGKRDLPSALKNRFTEFFVDELTNKEDLHAFVYQYLEAALPAPPVEDIVSFYLVARQEADARLLDGANQKPQYSLRSLARALEYTKAAMSVYGFQRSLYDGICMSFLTLLDRPSALIMEQLILGSIFKQTGAAASKHLKSILKVPLQPSPRHVLFEQFWVEGGDVQPTGSALESSQRYVLTTSIREHLKNLARAVFVRKNPVLLQGPTSSGKTSMIEYLALKTGHRFVRVNNHEHTDLQEYLGTYVTDNSGKLVFQEGILVQAVRRGYWIVLDELNLAPSDVLEALNRLLDDNRELFVPELQVMVKPHPHFMLFATQNPPGIYGGRKLLSRAFRNRFIELHVDDIPDDELQVILERRCQIPGSYASKMVEVMKDLQRHRRGSKVFAGKHGFITPRDLFRWADRHGNGYEELAWDGYMLLAERLRDREEKMVVQQTLEKHMHVKIQPGESHDSFNYEKVKGLQGCPTSPAHLSSFDKIVWTKSMKRLFNLVERCVRHSEPVLLVGDTGCGKTTVCQLLALLLQQKLHILNCHQNSETADFIGGLRPVRDRDNIAVKYCAAIQRLSTSRQFSEVSDEKLSSRIEDSASTMNTIRHALVQIRSRYKSSKSSENVQTANCSEEMQEGSDIEGLENELLDLQREYQSLFKWHDGPLVEAMRNGDFFLIDEISLADDSVLERLNSVLEPKRLLVLAEKGGSVVEELIAHPRFRLLATMNPGGDFGKKELSPALRNRFTEIWVPPIDDIEDLKSIVTDRFARPELLYLKDPLLDFWQWFQRHGDQGRLLSMRDLLSWINFINITAGDIGSGAAFAHGALLVLLDSIGLGAGLSSVAAQQVRSRCLEHLLQLLPEGEQLDLVANSHFDGHTLKQKKTISAHISSSVEVKRLGASVIQSSAFGIHPFYIPRGGQLAQNVSFELAAPTTSWNALRILRAMQLSKPVLLEGSPGVGKTSLVSALAFSSCHPLVRINLSEQTDVMDLFGSDMPVEGGKSGEFVWSDGVFLQALKAGHWVLLDELNLASQSVLEGLNACLDHRNEVFIPELGKVFTCPPTFRVFACQNPTSQGGGRKGLPKSFLNRFTKVYVDALEEDDFLFIARALHPSISESVLQKMVHFNARLYEDTMVAHAYGHSGAPWEFNLRDILRWCELLEGMTGSWSQKKLLECFLDVVYLQRMRTKEDRHHVLRLYREVFGTCANINTHPIVSISPESLCVGQATLLRRCGTQQHRDSFNQLQLLPGLRNSLEALMHCVRRGWMCNVVGHAAVGKTSLIRLLAALTGNTLHEFALSSGTDTTELLGCFEQHDPFRHWQDIIKRAQASIEAICSYCLSVPVTTTTVDRKLELIKSLLSSWAAFHTCLRSRSQSTSWLNLSKERDSLDPLAVEMLVQTVGHLERTCNVCGMPELDPKLQPHHLLECLTTVQETLGQVHSLGRFEWIDGGLLKAIEHGDWVLLENANFCNPTVLDRLNPLLEPGGTILINERGLVDGEAMVVRAHPNFRLFLTVDPSHGEVSRAMRNRGVEIFMMQPDWINPPSEKSLEIHIEDMSHDAYKLIVHAGIPSSSLTKAMFVAHADVESFTESLPGRIHVSPRELSNWLSLLQQLLERGAKLPWSLACSWVQTYVRHLDNVEAREAALHIFKSRIATLDFLNKKIWKETCLFVPGGWPTPHSLELFCMRSQEACVKHDTMYLGFLVAQLIASRATKEWQSLVKTGADHEKCISWLWSKRDSLIYFPASLVETYLNPLIKLHNDSDSNSEDVIFQIEEAKMKHASLWMVERGNLSDIGLRIQWLDRCALTMGSVCQIFVNLALVLRRELRHILAKQLCMAWEHLATVTGGSFLHKLVPYASHGTLLSLNEDLSDENNEGLKNARIQVIFLGRKLLALRHSLLQWQVEDEVYKSAQTQGVVSSTSPLLQSYLYHTYGAVGMRSLSPQIPKIIINYIYPLFNSLRNLENEILIATGVDLWEATLEKAFLMLQEWHEALWGILNQVSFDSESFLFYWIQMKKSLVGIIDLTSDISSIMKKIATGLQDIVQIVDETFDLGRSSAFKPLLWKHGGHPQLLNSKELFELEVQVLALCENLWQTSGREEDKQPSCTDVELRRIVMEGMSMGKWLRQKNLRRSIDESKQGSMPFTVHEAQHECGEIFKMLVQKLEMQELSHHEVVMEDVVLFGKTTVGSKRKKSLIAGCKCVDQHQIEHLAQGDLMCLPTYRKVWSELLPWLDYQSISIDMVLLAKISAASTLWWGDSDLSRALQEQGLDTKSVSSVLDFSLTSSSRSPVDFVPHQQVLWIINAMTSTTPDVCVALQDVSHEMWYRWHQAIWGILSKQPGQFSSSWKVIKGPARLFQATQSVILSSKLGDQKEVKEFQMVLAQLRISSMYMWDFQKQRFPDALSLDLCSLDALFQQIVLAHEKSFDLESFTQIRSLLYALHEGMITVSVDGDKQQSMSKALEQLSTLLRLSQHAGLLEALDTLVLPCAALLYCTPWKTLCFTEALLQHGHVWWLVGSIRLRLLLPVGSRDPTAKYSFKHRHALHRLASLNVEIEVRHESELITRGSGKTADILLMESRADDLQLALSALSFKIIPRPQRPRFRDLCQDVQRFMDLSGGSERFKAFWWTKLEGEKISRDLDKIIQETLAWQENSENFIHHLSRDYSAYKDFVQPVQQAVYELKLGLSLSLSACVQQDALDTDVLKQNNKVLADLIVLLMEFPSETQMECLSDGCHTYDKARTSVGAKLVGNATENIVLWAVSCQKHDAAPEEVVKLRMKLRILQIALLRSGQQVLQSCWITKTDLELLKFIFSSFSSLWRDIREYQLDQRRQEAEVVKFKTSTYSMDTEETLDEEMFKKMFPDYKSDYDTFVDTMASSAEEDDRRAQEANEKHVNEDIILAEKAWAKMEEALLNDVTHIQQSIFPTWSTLGHLSNTECDHLKEVSDEERLRTFSLSYETGGQLLQAIGHCIPASLDERLLPAHLMKSNMEFQYLTGASSPDVVKPRLNMYTDAHPSEIALMLDPVAAFMNRVVDILNEWPEHPILQQLLQISKTLLSFTLDTVVMKALRGVELLLSKAQLWEENAAKHVSLAGELSRLAQLVTRWRKLELEGWSFLLKETERKHSFSAKKLWFPLYDLLYRPVHDMDSYLEATLSSIEEFMQTATFGEFRTRLDLVQTFYLQFSVENRVIASSSGFTMVQRQKLTNILYNVFKYYSQFLSTLDELVSSEKAIIEKELKEFVQLSKWDDRSYYTLLLSAEKSHLKLHKFVKKYNELLKRSVSELLSKRALRMGTQNLSFLELASKTDEISLRGSVDDRLPWETVLSKKSELKGAKEKESKTMALGSTADKWQMRCNLNLLQLKNADQQDPAAGVYQTRLPTLTAKIGELLGAYVFSEGSSNNRLHGVGSLEMLSTSVIIRSSELRNSDKGLAVKKKAFADLLDVLKKIGLSERQSAVPKLQRSAQSWLHLRPAEVGRMIYSLHRNSPAEGSGHTDFHPVEPTITLWNKASDYYFNNMALLQHLQRSALAFHKDLSLREVKLSTTYTERLLYLQQCQREKAHLFCSNLVLLGQLCQALSSCGNSPLPRQRLMRKWMWQQKSFFDSLHQVVSETLLLFKSSESIQSCPANLMRVEAGTMKFALLELLAGVHQCQIRLNVHLLPCDDGVDIKHMLPWPLLYTPAMLDDLLTNFSVVNETQATFRKLFGKETTRDLENFSGLRPLQQILLKGYEMHKQFELESVEFTHKNGKERSELLLNFTSLYEKVVSEILLAVQKVSKMQLGTGRVLSSLTNPDDSTAGMVEGLELEEKLMNIEKIIEGQIDALSMERICDAILNIFKISDNLIDIHGMEDELALRMGRLFACIGAPLEMLHAAVMCLLSDYICLHKSVTKLGYILSNLFISLCSDGFCICKEEEGQEGGNKIDDASGTGMGEGEGKKDVSEQIENEEQLINGTEKVEDALQDKEEKNADKGIEMEQDFTGDMMDLSEDEPEKEDPSEEDEDVNLESRMGEGDDGQDIVDEKLWNGEDENDQEPDGKEKYEKDAGVSGAKPEDLEMRGKEEAGEKDVGKGNQDEDKDQLNDPTGIPSEEHIELEKEEEEYNQNNKDEAFEDSSGVKPSIEDTLDLPEDLNLDGEEEEKQGEEQQGNAAEAKEVEEVNDDSEAMDIDEDSHRVPDEELGDSELNTGERDTEGPEEVASPDMDVVNEPSSKDGDVEDKGTSKSNEEMDGSAGDDITETLPEQGDDPSVNQNMDPRTSGKPLEHTSVVPGIMGNSTQLNNPESEPQDKGVAQAPQQEEFVGFDQSSLETVDGVTRMSVSSELSTARLDTETIERPRINPYRSLGDALKDWKERLNVVDTGEVELDVGNLDSKRSEPPSDHVDDGLEYEFVTKEEKSSGQALGSATEEQLDEAHKIEAGPTERDAVDEMLQPNVENIDPPRSEISERIQETEIYANNRKPRLGNVKHDTAEQIDGVKDATPERDTGLLDLEVEPEVMNPVDDSVVSVQNQKSGQDFLKKIEFLDSTTKTCSEEDISRLRNELETGLKGAVGNIEAARVIWQKYEHLTARLSQELAEQLRLILEPTLASKLEGDYKTGKRINMKKIIPYIASSFRKDKIWLRRTKANKRQYQVVLAIDDSRSMSESHCGHMAVEALITICRAMSQVEIGQMAVASFGQRGNVHLLHDFDQPFTSEAGVNMVSQFSFNQDNTIADQPMVDLLQFLTRMLDVAASHAAIPAGNVNLQQLVLIIADGRFHEKESLRRCIREATGRKQLLAFIVLDNPHESLLDMQSVSFTHGPPSFSKYLDSFPFPYYILLRDIESLPRTLADLMRQWFELTQRSTSGQ